MNKWFLFFGCLLIDNYYSYSMEDPKKGRAFATESSKKGSYSQKFEITNLNPIPEEAPQTRFGLRKSKEKKKNKNDKASSSDEIGWVDAISPRPRSSSDSEQFNDSTIEQDKATLPLELYKRRLTRSLSESFIKMGSHFLKEELSLAALVYSSPLTPEKQKYRSNDVLKGLIIFNRLSPDRSHESMQAYLGLCKILMEELYKTSRNERDLINQKSAAQCEKYLRRFERRYFRDYYVEQAQKYYQLAQGIINNLYEFSETYHRLAQENPFQSHEDRIKDIVIRICSTSPHYHEDHSRSLMLYQTIIRFMSIIQDSSSGPYYVQDPYKTVLLYQTVLRFLRQSHYYHQRAQDYGCQIQLNTLSEINEKIDTIEKNIHSRLVNYEKYLDYIAKAKKIEEKKVSTSIRAIRLAQEINPDFKKKTNLPQRLSELVQFYQTPQRKSKSLIKKGNKIKAGSGIHASIMEMFQTKEQEWGEIGRTRKSKRSPAELSDEGKDIARKNEYLHTIDNLQKHYYEMAQWFIKAFNINPDLKIIYIVQGIIDKINDLENDKKIPDTSTQDSLITDEFIGTIQHNLTKLRTIVEKTLQEILIKEKQQNGLHLSQGPFYSKFIGKSLPGDCEKKTTSKKKKSLFFKQALALLLPRSDKTGKCAVKLFEYELSGMKLVEVRLKLNKYLLQQWHEERAKELRPTDDAFYLIEMYENQIAEEEQLFNKLVLCYKGQLFTEGAQYFFSKSSDEKVDNNFTRLLYLNKAKECCKIAQISLQLSKDSGSHTASKELQVTFCLLNLIKESKQEIIDEVHMKRMKSIKDKCKSNEEEGYKIYNRLERLKKNIKSLENKIGKEKASKKSSSHSDLGDKLKRKKQDLYEAMEIVRNYFTQAAQAYNEVFNNNPRAVYLNRSSTLLTLISELQHELYPNVISDSQSIIGNTLRIGRKQLEEADNEWRKEVEENSSS